MKNTFKNNVESYRHTIEAVKTSEAAKNVQQYGALDVYNLVKNGQAYLIVVDGIVIGAAKDEKDANAAIEYLTHFTGGVALDKNSLCSAIMKCHDTLNTAHNLLEAEGAGIKIKDNIVCDGKEYVIDDTGELFDTEGHHITNIADVIESRSRGGLSDDLYLEILTNRIRKAKGGNNSKN
jgi:hypothetical protein